MLGEIEGRKRRGRQRMKWVLMKNILIYIVKTNSMPKQNSFLKIYLIEG